MKYTRLLSSLLYFAVVKLGLCVKIYLSAFEVSITGVLVAFAVRASILLLYATVVFLCILGSISKTRLD